MPAPLTTTLLTLAAIAATLDSGLGATILGAVAFLFEFYLFVAAGSVAGDDTPTA